MLFHQDVIGVESVLVTPKSVKISENVLSLHKMGFGQTFPKVREVTTWGTQTNAADANVVEQER